MKKSNGRPIVTRTLVVCTREDTDDIEQRPKGATAKLLQNLNSRRLARIATCPTSTKFDISHLEVTLGRLFDTQLFLIGGSFLDIG